ncbi:MAG: hypothetical protein ACFFBP_05905 [Promethearchaeota archaeon]
MEKKDAVISIKKKKTILYPFCKTCGKPMKPRRRIESDLYFHLWIIAILASLGLILPIFLIYHFYIKKKKYCGYCLNRIKFYDNPNKFPGSKGQIDRIIQQIESEKTEFILCNFCHEKIDSKSLTCPYCGIHLHEE